MVCYGREIAWPTAVLLRGEGQSMSYFLQLQDHVTWFYAPSESYKKGPTTTVVNPRVVGSTQCTMSGHSVGHRKFAPDGSSYIRFEAGAVENSPLEIFGELHSWRGGRDGFTFRMVTDCWMTVIKFRVNHVDVISFWSGSGEGEM